MITGYERPLAATHAAPGARLLRELPLAGGQPLRQASAPRSTTTRDAEEHRDAHAARRAHGQRRGARQGDARHPLAHRAERRVRRDDVQKRTIPLGPRSRGKDGKTTTYFDATSKVGRAEMDQMPKRRMECIDCHNAAGHPFANPADRVDDAIAEGTIDRSLPSIKARARRDHREGRRRSHGPMEEQVAEVRSRSSPTRRRRAS